MRILRRLKGRTQEPLGGPAGCPGEIGKRGPIEGVKSWAEPGVCCDPESSEGRRSALRLNWREWETGTVLEWLKVSALVVIAAGVALCSWLLLNIYTLLCGTATYLP